MLKDINKFGYSKYFSYICTVIENVMGRILFILFVAFIMTLVVVVVNNYLNRRNGNTMSREEKRKSFNDDIEAVAKEIKMRREV